MDLFNAIFQFFLWWFGASTLVQIAVAIPIAIGFGVGVYIVVFIVMTVIERVF